ncbi:histidine phosphatase family protein [Paenibacillus rhizovicinus]|uniref:Histidine phosphatase family protein n=1 Tax=Paenibacillus rhizovicinus TaxID=2704463 RepID=A0A6C0NZS3_9BACL|nr:histidine phosphatase family protein [Paenibacillus rhizovicinus]QHW31734.1 histidine phosphatase family protein [Paenibacillus rhizovicinus]
MKLYVARHGQTDWNAEDRICGISDIPLNRHGVEQAQALADKLAEFRLAAILSSPLGRARETAAIIARAAGLDYTADARLIERNYGAFEGTSRHAEAFRQAKRQFPGRLDGGESLLQVGYRVYGLIEETRARYGGQSVLFVTHGGICKVIHSYFNDLSNEAFHAFHAKNGAFQAYECGGDDGSFTWK